MTVKELIDYLKEMPQDSTVIIENDYSHVHGFYEAGYLLNYGDGTVEVCADYERKIEEE